jgi:hypothetical protein
MVYRVAIAKDEQVFWVSQPVSGERAEIMRLNNQRLIDKHGWRHVVRVERADIAAFGGSNGAR